MKDPNSGDTPPMDERARELLATIRELQGTGRLVEIGRLWAESGDYKGGLPPGLPEEVVGWVYTDWLDYPPSLTHKREKEIWVVASEAGSPVVEAAAGRLVEFYLEETGVDSAFASSLEFLERNVSLFAAGPVAMGEQEMEQELRRRLNALQDFQKALKNYGSARSKPDELDRLSAYIANGAWELEERWTQTGEEGIAFLGPMHGEINTLQETLRVEGRKLKDHLRRLLTNKAGEEQPHVLQWFSAKGWKTLYAWAPGALQEYENERLKRELEKERGLRLEAELRAKFVEKRAKTGPVKRGMGALQSQFLTPKKARGLARGGGVAPDESKKVTLYDPTAFGWGEQAALIGLLNLAEEAGQLAGLPASGRATPLQTQNTDVTIRARVPAFSVSEIAERVGYDRGGDGRVPKHVRDALARGLEELQKPRWWALKVKRKTRDGEFRDSVVTRKEPLLTPEQDRDGGDFWLVSPAVFAGQLRQFILMPPPGRRWEKARDALGEARMRDEWTRLEAYCHYRAKAKAAEAQRLRGAEEEPITLGELIYTADAKENTLFEACGWKPEQWKKRGRPYYREKLETALEFCREVGALNGWKRRKVGRGYTYALKVHDPAALVEGEQITALLGE